MNDESNVPQHALRGITRRLLDLRVPPWSLRPGVLELQRLLTAAAGDGFREDAEIASGESRSARGLALSPTMAAMCVADYVRTIVFLRGLHAAISAHRSGDPARPTRILYAGTGPFATLAVPLMSVLDPSEAVFTLLDLHPEAIRSVESVVRHFGLERQVERTAATDALDYTIDPEEPPDVILVEIMQACLEAEPQVAITRHLLVQAPGAVLLPEEVRIELKLVDPAREFSGVGEGGEVQPLRRDRLPVGPVFVLNKEAVANWVGLAGTELPGRAVQLPGAWEDRYQPMLFTTVRVHGDHLLDDYDSGLTCPRIPTMPVPLRPGDILSTTYRLGTAPGLRLTVGDDPGAGGPQRS